MDIGQAVREARKSGGLTQQALANMAGLSRRAIILLEANGGRISSLQSAAVVLGLRVTGLPAGQSLAVQVSRARTKRKMTQAALAEASGISIPTVREIESGAGSVASLSAVLAVLAPNAKRRRHPRSHWGSVTDERFTPPAWLTAIEETIGPISIDPCYDPRSFVRAAKYLTQAEDGLTTRWCGHLAYVNPPYSQNATWIHRCADAWRDREVEIVVSLLPARIETAAFHDRVVGSADIILLRGKPRFFNEFGEQMPIAPFAGMVVIWGAAPQCVIDLAERLGGSIVWAHKCSGSPAPCDPVSELLAAT
ncbi:DNA N-6-adenine-methyltransferase [Sphingomonas sp. PB2P19]|uniref:DNA N-6-adenine-methyltransferase n=1 Tax=Sphingomonas rhamnosi TaxID=3096156 RepID=UPI002FCC4E75